jgi:transcriptional regulator with XRE-family HTH domain
MNFGGFIKELRLESGIGLREFCKTYGHDPSNWSKMERGVLPPPSDREILEKWAKQLGIKEGTKKWYDFFDLASVEKGRIPEDLLNDEEFVKKLPLFFRTIRGQKPTKEELKELANLLKKG